MARTHENKQFPSFAHVADDSQSFRVFGFLSRALIWFVRFCLLIKRVCLFYLFLGGPFELQTMTGCLFCPDANRPQGGTHPQQATRSSQDFFPPPHCYEHADVSWCNEKEEMRGGHKCVWCMQGLMESTFASTLGTKQERWEGERHPSETERSCPNGEGK